MMWLPRSLAARVVTFSTLWAVLALVVIATVVSTLFRDASNRGFESLLSANLFNLIASVNVVDSELAGSPELGDARDHSNLPVSPLRQRNRPVTPWA